MLGNMMRYVFDTPVLVAARRSRGASNALLSALDERKCFKLLASVPLFLEYEHVLTQPGNLQAFGLERPPAIRFLDWLAKLATPVELHRLWRPLLADVGDDLVLETAVCGEADAIVTLRAPLFDAATGGRLPALSPAEALKRIVA